MINMSDEGTTEDALRKLGQIDTSRLNEILAEMDQLDCAYDAKRFGFIHRSNGFHIGKFVILWHFNIKKWRLYAGRRDRMFRVVFAWGIGLGPIEIRKKHYYG